MHSRITLFAAFAAILLVAGCQDAALTATESTNTEVVERNGDIIPGRYIVVVKSDPDVAGKEPMLVARELAGRPGIHAEHLYGSSIVGFSGSMSGEALSVLRADDRVAYIEPDRVITLPPMETAGGGDVGVGGPPPGKGPGNGGGNGGGSDPQETPWGITRVGDAGDGTGRTAWVIDTGIDLNHQDLNVDAARGFNAFTSGKDGKSLDDGSGHGTHVAGTIAAKNDSRGVVGVAADAFVVPVKVLNSRGSGSYSGVIAGVDHVAANGNSGDVANMSLGGPVSAALDAAVLAASNTGIVFVLAAGNSGADANNSSPARVNGNKIYTISAFAEVDNFASFSNYGNPPIDYAAPGVGIKSTWKGGDYNTISGTSMAAPHAAGVLLLGIASTDETVNGDPDGNADPIIHR